MSLEHFIDWEPRAKDLSTADYSDPNAAYWTKKNNTEAAPQPRRRE
jgi:hypothetical protein